jgi:hypothetical protein
LPDGICGADTGQSILNMLDAKDRFAGCGGLTGVTPLVRYRAWIVEMARTVSSPLTR